MVRIHPGSPTLRRTLFGLTDIPKALMGKYADNAVLRPAANLLRWARAANRMTIFSSIFGVVTLAYETDQASSIRVQDRYDKASLQRKNRCVDLRPERRKQDGR